MKALRQSIYDNCDEFREILEEPALKKLYHGLDNERALKVMPRPFPKDFPYPELLKQRDYLTYASKKESFFENDDWLYRTAEELSILYPFNRFLNYTCDEMNE